MSMRLDRGRIRHATSGCAQNAKERPMKSSIWVVERSLTSGLDAQEPDHSGPSTNQQLSARTPEKLRRERNCCQPGKRPGRLLLKKAGPEHGDPLRHGNACIDSGERGQRAVHALKV
jgi:hypothetical protein